MKHTAIDPKTQKLVPSNEASKALPHKYVPRIRCLDCPGRGKFLIPSNAILSLTHMSLVYMTGPGTTAESFEAHLKNRNHRIAVDARVAKAAV